jgi:dihydrofolate reductase
MRKVKYYVACSADGFIAHEDGTWGGFLQEGEHVTDYLASLDQFDVALMGRKTYEVGLKLGKTDPYPNLESYVFSRSMKESPDERVTLVSEDVGPLVRRLKDEEGKGIYLCGGAALAAALFEEGLIDEIVLKVNPFVMGAGIPLFAGPIRQTALELAKTTVYENGCVWLFYRVKKG